MSSWPGDIPSKDEFFVSKPIKNPKIPLSEALAVGRDVLYISSLSAPLPSKEGYITAYIEIH